MILFGVMTVIESLPDSPMEERSVRGLAEIEGVRAAVPLASIDRKDARPATFGTQQVAGIYLHVEDSKHLLAYSQQEGEWRSIETIDDAVVKTFEGDFDTSSETLCEWIRDRLADPTAAQVGTISTTHPGHPYSDG